MPKSLQYPALTFAAKLRNLRGISLTQFMLKPFKTTRLDRRWREKRRENEKRRQQTLQRVLELLPRLAQRYGFHHAYILGSVTKKGRFRQNSAIDLAIEGLGDEKYFTFWAEVSDKFNREVDVIQIEKHRLEKNIQNGR